MQAYLAIGQWIIANWREAAILIFGGAVLARELAFFSRERRRGRDPVALNLASGPHQGALDLSTYAKKSDLERVEASVNDAIRIASDAMFATGRVEEDVKTLTKEFRDHREEFVVDRAERRADTGSILAAIEGRFPK